VVAQAKNTRRKDRSKKGEISLHLNSPVSSQISSGPDRAARADNVMGGRGATCQTGQHGGEGEGQ